MSGRVVFRRVFLAVLVAASLLTSLGCYDDDDGYGPIGPPDPVPRIDGIWRGVFSTDEGDSAVLFDLRQRGRDVSGFVILGGIEWSLRGDVDSRGIFRWRTDDGTCGSFDGSTDLVTATQMVGDADLDRFFCPEGERLRGDLDLDLRSR